MSTYNVIHPVKLIAKWTLLLHFNSVHIIILALVFAMECYCCNYFIHILQHKEFVVRNDDDNADDIHG